MKDHLEELDAELRELIKGMSCQEIIDLVAEVERRSKFMIASCVVPLPVSVREASERQPPSALSQTN